MLFSQSKPNLPPPMISFTWPMSGILSSTCGVSMTSIGTGKLRSLAAIKRFRQDLSAIHNKSLTRHESSMDGGKEGSRKSDIARRAKTLQGHSPDHLLSIIFP